MKRISCFLAGLCLLAGMSSAMAQHIELNSPYAIENCRAGCYLVNKAEPIYYGTIARTYRICSADNQGGVISVDGRTMRIPGTAGNVRSCRDIHALSISLTEGVVAVGLLP
ncbi:hypothetical protein [Massilia niastensis]|uniref:hypothetical protein n=1 Tax=Massilia niastensis TaxID=544911 RepID=UPI0003606CAF|nr:hypothetical protein [Massilia niastensis]